jgi:molybdopterin converting factor subunit 1
MRINLLTFGATREIIKSSELSLELADDSDVNRLRLQLNQDYPELVALNSLFIAVNEEYADGAHVLHDGDEVALIPPVSGG